MRGTWSILSHNLPRLKAGRPMSAARLNAALEALDRTRPVIGSGGGLELTQLPSGTAYRATKAPGRHIAITTSTITAATGLTYGYGTAAFAENNGTALSAGTIPIPKLNNYHDRTIANGSVVWVDQNADGSWWVIDVARCASLS